MATSQIKIIVIDDNKTFLQSVEFYLSHDLSYTIINKAYDGAQFLELKNIHEADIILMDIEMPELNGIKATKKALSDNSQLQFIALTNYEEKAYLTDLIYAGFKGCVFKKNTFNQIDKAIHTVMEGHMFFPDGIKL